MRRTNAKLFLCSDSTCGCGLCYMYAKTKPECLITFLKGDKAALQALNYDASFVGGKCKHNTTNSTINGDPHLVGARGTHFDFSGEPGHSYCLVSDENVHVNMGLKGYLDTRTESATRFTEDGKAIRTWIQNVGVIWKAQAARRLIETLRGVTKTVFNHEGAGVEHKMLLSARLGPKVERGEGFMAEIVLDGVALPKLLVGESVALAGGATLKFEGYEVEGPYDVDYYTLTLQSLVIIDLRLRVADPRLRIADEAEVHFNVGFRRFLVRI